MAEIIKLDCVTKHDISASEMLRNIAENDPIHAFVIVWPKDGKMPTYHCSTADMPVVLMRCQQFIHKCFDGTFMEEHD